MNEKVIPPLPPAPQAEQFARSWNDSVPVGCEQDGNPNGLAIVGCTVAAILIVAVSIYCGVLEQRELDTAIESLGTKACVAGVSAEANPYTESRSRTLWLNGWVKAKRGE